MEKENKMILIHKDNRTFHHCSCFFSSLAMECEIVPEDMKEEIPTYYSEKHAYDNGWRVTKNSKYCPPDQNIVWVCPVCSESEGWLK